MAAKKPMWQIAAIDRYICDAKKVGATSQQLAHFKKLKRRPPGLLALEDQLRDMARIERLKRKPKGSEEILAALMAEQNRIEGKVGHAASVLRPQGLSAGKVARAPGENRLARQ